MELSKEYMLSQYQELGMLNGNNSVRLVRHSITGRIAVKKYMPASQKPVYVFLKLHRNEFIPEIYGYFENESQLIIIEEYIEGRNLEDILSEQRMPVEEGVRIVKEVCRGLYPLHTAVPPIICRDLKPENIMLTLQKHVKLIDFDIARVVSPGKNRDTVIMGTEGFAAPEQQGMENASGGNRISADSKYMSGYGCHGKWCDNYRHKGSVPESSDAACPAGRNCSSIQFSGVQRKDSALKDG